MKIEAVFDEKRTAEGVVAHAVSMNPRITNGQGEHKERK